MVDTIKCQSELDLTEKFYEKLLLGAIDKRLDHKKLEAHHPAEDGQDTALALPLRSKIINKGKDRRWSDNETLVAPTSRGNSLQGHRSSTMQPVYESPIDDARPAAPFERRPSNMTTSSSPPSAGFGPPSRHATFHNAIQEAEEPDSSAVQRRSTYESQKSRYLK